MPTIAYLANQFPSAVEWYVAEEIQELRRRGVRVIPCSARRANMVDPGLREFEHETLYLEPLSFGLLWRTARMLVRQHRQVGDLVERILLRERESLSKRARALLHTLLGAYYAAQLCDLGVEHIHVHHGYFASWIALVAARLLGIRFSMTLHGSDLLVHARHLDSKLAECGFCVTISEFNRRHLLAHYPAADPHKIYVQRLGVNVPTLLADPRRAPAEQPVLLAVGRLHAVKNYPFLVQACFYLRETGINFRCFIAGDGPDRQKLEWLIEELKLKEMVTCWGTFPMTRSDTTTGSRTWWF